jgi:uncharacterized protein YbjT (DUF2867 family)
MRQFVTGASGLIGKRVVKTLDEQQGGVDVTIRIAGHPIRRADESSES